MAPELETELEAGEARRALIVISLGVLLASSTWFSGTAAARELAELWSLDARASARLTSATQWGFIAGTLIYALANLADRFDPRRVFCASALAGALANPAATRGRTCVRGPSSTCA